MTCYKSKVFCDEEIRPQIYTFRGKFQG